MVEILAHRANLSGSRPDGENSFAAVQAALKLGFGIEIDLRRDPSGRFYIGHDAQPWAENNDFGEFARLFREFPDRTIAINVKELGYEKELITFQHSGCLGTRSFYFDFELLEPMNPGRTQRLIQDIADNRRVTVASRLSDRGEPLEQCLSIPASVVWADEFDSFWLRRHHVEAVHAAGRAFYAISPELHGYNEVARLKRWERFQEWGIDGLCTDYGLSAQQVFVR